MTRDEKISRLKKMQPGYGGYDDLTDAELDRFIIACGEVVEFWWVVEDEYGAVIRWKDGTPILHCSEDDARRYGQNVRMVKVTLDHIEHSSRKSRRSS